ncbi:uncharacterized protein APUU_61050S [Aspergillus puulaauensis]|uniref:AMP-binding enzyme C-terminal domain-containing protein n=1 Tax=Aspergillus puulaauensis TaxID=1220207 RepID=A0A7R8ARE1_9EURO|nr:uncharacterized protein APUU_61050S [Aspergillus puulaauensis]BCS28002.1 hypothetical protein APUU_61050S [Aspergillus puulaauensis]
MHGQHLLGNSLSPSNRMGCRSHALALVFPRVVSCKQDALRVGIERDSGPEAKITLGVDIPFILKCQVSPREIEEVVRSHKAVNDAAAVALELEDGNELPTAFVVLENGVIADLSRLLDDIGTFVEKHVNPYKKLRGGVHVVDEIPKNAMGKVQRLRQKTAQTKL